MASDDSQPGDYVPVGPADVDDLALLPRRFDAFVNEFRFSFELLANKILPKLDRIEETVAELRRSNSALFIRVEHLESQRDDHARRLAALEAAISKPRRRAPRK